MWYVLINDDQLGPMSDADLRQLIVNGVVDESALVWAESMTDWVPLSESPFADHEDPVAQEQPGHVEDDGTLVASPDDESLKAELAALFEQSQVAADVIDRRTAQDHDGRPDIDDEPATIAMPSFVPGDDILESLSPPKEDELSMTLGAAHGVKPIRRDVHNGEGESDESPKSESVGDDEVEMHPSDNEADSAYSQIDESVLRQARGTLVGHGLGDQGIPEPGDSDLSSGLSSGGAQGSGLNQVDDSPQAVPVERQTAVQDSRTSSETDYPADLEPAAPVAIHDAKQIGRLAPSKKPKWPLALGFVVLLSGIGLALVMQADDEVVQPKVRPKAIKIGMSSDDIIRAAKAKADKSDAKEADLKVPTAPDANATKPVDAGPTQSMSGDTSKSQRSIVPRDEKAAADAVARKNVASPANKRAASAETKPASKSTKSKAAVGTNPKNSKAVSKPVRKERVKPAEQLGNRRRAVDVKKKASRKVQPKSKPKKSNLFGGAESQASLPFSLNHKQITRALGKRRGLLKRCLGDEKNLKNAKVMIALTIKRNGRPANVRAISGSVRGTKIGRCIEKVITGVRFPRFSGDHMQLTVPIRL